MGDLILRCDVLDNIKKRIYFFDKASFDEAVKAVCNAPAVDAMPRWISVEERLPTLEDASANELVICVCRGEDDKPIAEEVHAWHFDVVRRMAPCFTHWMPMNGLFSLLPEPPKEDSHV